MSVIERLCSLPAIMVNKMLLPTEDNDLGGIRIGTTAVTRFGTTPTDMHAAGR
jgi:glycine/serine hydroxymethyltransferase